MKGTTKGTKVKPASTAREEECGIWLDTTELKEKKQQKHLTRPISKLLNPLARSSGYNVAVSLSFTQTKLNMPVTKQSTISAFFSPKCTDPKPSASHDGMYPSMHTAVCSGSKRKHEVTSEDSDITNQKQRPQTFEVYKQNCDLDYEDVSAKDSDDRKERSFLRLMSGHQTEEEEPPEKRRAFASYAEHNVLETQEYWNKEKSATGVHPHDIETVPETETLFHSESQGFDLLMVRKPSKDVCGNVLQNQRLKDLQGLKDKHVLRDQNTTIEGSVLTSRPVNANHKRAKAFAISNMDQEKSGYKPKASPMKQTGKENRQPASPIHNTPSSPNKRNLLSSPAKSKLKEKYVHSPKKLSKEESGREKSDSLAMLFTQDSEGFCVIAHRDQHLMSPLKDHSNLSNDRDYWNSPSVKSLDKRDDESDLEAEMLFTQDSEGNMVIKH